MVRVKSIRRTHFSLLLGLIRIFFFFNFRLKQSLSEKEKAERSLKELQNSKKEKAASDDTLSLKEVIHPAVMKRSNYSPPVVEFQGLRLLLF